MPENQEKEDNSEKYENEGDSKKGDEFEFLMALDYRGQLSFDDIELLIEYVNARLVRRFRVMIWPADFKAHPNADFA